MRPRVARSASAWWNATKTLLQSAAMWGVFFALLPAAVFTLEARSGLAAWRFDAGAGGRAAAVVAFVVLGALGLGTGVQLAVLGDGTPLPLDTARRLVIRGAYRHVRNPMAMTSLAQGAAIGVWLGSPAVLAYVVAGAALWQFVARPWEERDLVARFGAEYEAYRGAVRCWVPRVRPYVPPDPDL